MATYNQEIKNMKLISHHDLNGFGNGGEGVALQQLPDGRRIFWIAHESAPKDLTALDVSDLTKPKIVLQTDLPYPYLRSNSLALLGDLLLVAYQANKPGLPGVGMGIYNVSNPSAPKRIGFFDTSGPYSRGVHCLWFVDGEYAHLSTGAADFQPRNQLDDQFYMIVDMKDPTLPAEAGRWWIPGIREGDDAPAPVRHPRFDSGHRVHNTNVYPQRPDRAYAGWLDSGFFILDVSDKSRPKVISQIDHHPPFAGFTHTVLPLFSRELLVVTDEANPGFEHCEDYPKLAWLVDARVESNPVMISSLPCPIKKTSATVPAASGRTMSTKTSPCRSRSSPTNWCSAPSSTPVCGSMIRVTPINPQKWPTSCRRSLPRRAPTQSMTSMSTRTELFTPSTVSREGCTSWR